MNILYKSTRGAESGVPSSQAVLNGLASDGGLYVPENFPKMETSLEALAEMNYREVAYEVMSLFLSDYTEEELKYCIDHAYDEKFDVPEVAPLKKADDAYYLELFHGKTIAFKDMALSILPYLMTTAARKNNITNKICILTATSGDTGKAAMAGFADVPGTEIIVFYPKDGVSPVQKRQMVTQKGENTHVVAILGNFDDAQTAVKQIFGNRELAEELDTKGIQFSSANSINIGRLIPQVAYYVYAYANLLKQGVIKAGDPINVTVPTGNFGNILAAYYAKQIGLPVGKLICASNENKVLVDFFRTGVYDRKRPFILTTSPSMDILVSSNLERLIYFIADRNTEKTAAFMKSLSEEGSYTITPEMQKEIADFYGAYASEEEVSAVIADIYKNDSYVLDPHTAVAASVYRKYKTETGDQTPTVIASTASPYKFARSVLHAIDAGKFDGMTDMEQFDALHEVSGVKVPDAIEEIKTAPVRHNTVSAVADMEATVKAMLGL
ncbi:MAG: threonine synthase [Eubacteriales bacterium]|nr:threonine synthase [Eubacteriales bacterium]